MAPRRRGEGGEDALGTGQRVARGEATNDAGTSGIGEADPRDDTPHEPGAATEAVPGDVDGAGGDDQAIAERDEEATRREAEESGEDLGAPVEEAVAPSSGSASAPAEEDAFPVVGIGASAGGLDALKRFVRGVKAGSGMAFVVVQHLDPEHESMMASLLGRHTDLEVVEAEDAVTLRPDVVYMIPPGKFIRIADGGLYLDKPVQRRGMRMPIDHFLRSLAETRGAKAIGVIMSGTGSDGSQGIREIKACGGLTVVQKPDTAEYDGMPRAALATGMVDLLLDIEEMPEALAQYAEVPKLGDDEQPGTGLDETAPDEFEHVCACCARTPTTTSATTRTARSTGVSSGAWRPTSTARSATTSST